MRKFPRIETPFLLQLASLPRAPDKTVLWNEVYSRDRPLRVEIGVGNSPFLIEVARQEPDFNYLGFEYCLRRVLKFLKKVHTAELDTIRMLRVEAMALLTEGFRPGSIDHIFVNFPDPWPKRKHAWRRFVRAETLEILCPLLRPGGGVSLRTDAPAYADQMAKVLDGCASLENRTDGVPFAPGPRYPYETPYEARFKAEGKQIFYFEYRKRQSHGG